jgi:hypothetical protein
MSRDMERILKEMTKVNMRNIIVFFISFVWLCGYSYSLFNYKEITESQTNTLSKLDTLITIIIGYYLKQDYKKE